MLVSHNSDRGFDTCGPSSHGSYVLAYTQMLEEILQNGVSYKQLAHMITTGEGVSDYGASTESLSPSCYTEWQIVPIHSSEEDFGYQVAKDRRLAREVIPPLDSECAIKKFLGHRASIAASDPHFPSRWKSHEHVFSRDEFMQKLEQEHSARIKEHGEGDKSTPAWVDLSNLEVDYWHINVADEANNGSYLVRVKEGYLYIPYKTIAESEQGYEQLLIENAFLTSAEDLEGSLDQVFYIIGGLVYALEEAIVELREKEEKNHAR